MTYNNGMINTVLINVHFLFQTKGAHEATERKISIMLIKNKGNFYKIYKISFLHI